ADPSPRARHGRGVFENDIGGSRRICRCAGSEHREDHGRAVSVQSRGHGTRQSGDVCRRIAWMRAEMFSPPPAYRPTLTERLPCINPARAGARSMLQAGASSSPGLPLPPSRLYGHTHAADHDPFQIIARQQGRDTAISPSLAWATTRISKKCKGRRYMLAASSLEYVSVRHDHAVEVPTE